MSVPTDWLSFLTAGVAPRFSLHTTDMLLQTDFLHLNCNIIPAERLANIISADVSEFKYLIDLVDNAVCHILSRTLL